MKKKEGMKQIGGPKEHFERDEGQLNPACGLKYGKEMGEPEGYDKMTAGLANYVKKNQMKYES